MSAMSPRNKQPGTGAMARRGMGIQQSHCWIWALARTRRTLFVQAPREAPLADDSSFGRDCQFAVNADSGQSNLMGLNVRSPRQW